MAINKKMEQLEKVKENHFKVMEQLYKSEGEVTEELMRQHIEVLFASYIDMYRMHQDLFKNYKSLSKNYYEAYEMLKQSVKNTSDHKSYSEMAENFIVGNGLGEEYVNYLQSVEEMEKGAIQ